MSPFSRADTPTHYIFIYLINLSFIHTFPLSQMLQIRPKTAKFEPFAHLDCFQLS